MIAAISIFVAAAVVETSGAVKRPRIEIGQPAFYSAKCPSAWVAVRWYRARYNTHRRILNMSLAPRVETGMNCARLRERAVYWVHAAKVNRQAAARVTARHTQVARQLNRGLAGTPMAGTGRELEQAGREHGIHPAFIAAIAATESSFGAAACSSNRFNAYGLANCQGIWHVPDFQSWRDSYRFMGRFLSGRWPHADTPYEFYGYAACDACWGRKVAFYMRRLGFGHGVRYR